MVRVPTHSTAEPAHMLPATSYPDLMLTNVSEIESMVSAIFAECLPLWL